MAGPVDHLQGSLVRRANLAALVGHLQGSQVHRANLAPEPAGPLLANQAGIPARAGRLQEGCSPICDFSQGAQPIFSMALNL